MPQAPYVKTMNKHDKMNQNFIKATSSLLKRWKQALRVGGEAKDNFLLTGKQQRRNSWLSQNADLLMSSTWRSEGEPRVTGSGLRGRSNAGKVERRRGTRWKRSRDLQREHGKATEWRKRTAAWKGCADGINEARSDPQLVNKATHCFAPCCRRSFAPRWRSWNKLQ